MWTQSTVDNFDRLLSQLADIFSCLEFLNNLLTSHQEQARIK